MGIEPPALQNVLRGDPASVRGAHGDLQKLAGHRGHGRRRQRGARGAVGRLARTVLSPTVKTPVGGERANRREAGAERCKADAALVDLGGRGAIGGATIAELRGRISAPAPSGAFAVERTRMFASQGERLKVLGDQNFLRKSVIRQGAVAELTRSVLAPAVKRFPAAGAGVSRAGFDLPHGQRTGFGFEIAHGRLASGQKTEDESGADQMRSHIFIVTEMALFQNRRRSSFPLDRA